MADLTKFKEIIAKEVDDKKTVSFNYPKYEEQGTPHDVWAKSVAEVEKVLDEIISKQPIPEVPLMYMRREEKDDSGRVIRVHFDVYGKATMVRETLKMFRAAENVYVGVNMAASKKMSDQLAKMAAIIKEKYGDHPTQEQITQVINETLGPPQMPKIAKKDGDEYLDKKAPLDLSGIDELEMDEQAEKPSFVMPNPDPDDFN